MKMEPAQLLNGGVSAALVPSCMRNSIKRNLILKESETPVREAALHLCQALKFLHLPVVFPVNRAVYSSLSRGPVTTDETVTCTKMCRFFRRSIRHFFLDNVLRAYTCACNRTAVPVTQTNGNGNFKASGILGENGGQFFLYNFCSGMPEGYIVFSEQNVFPMFTPIFLVQLNFPRNAVVQRMHNVSISRKCQFITLYGML